MIKCFYCGALHETLCPRIKAIELDDSDRITRIEFLTPMDYPQVKPEAPEQDYPRLVPRE